MKSTVKCPICNRELKEINNRHLGFHKMTKEEFDKKYPKSERLSELTRSKKSTNKGRSTEKMKYCHTENSFKERYGEEIGKLKFEESRKRKSFSNTLEGYIKRFGEVQGLERYTKDKKNKGVTLEKYISKFGKEKGEQEFLKWKDGQKYRTSIDFFIEKYGEKEGIEKFQEKYKKSSDKKRSISIDLIDEYSIYCLEVDRFTRKTIKNHRIENIELRGKKNGFQLDHKISKFYGFNNNIKPEIIGSYYNLQIITTRENCSKQEKCVDLEKILEQFKSEQ